MPRESICVSVHFSAGAGGGGGGGRETAEEEELSSFNLFSTCLREEKKWECGEKGGCIFDSSRGIPGKGDRCLLPQFSSQRKSL